MNIQEAIDTLNNLDPDNIGSWPFIVKIVIWIGAMLLAGVLVFQLQLKNSLADLQTKQNEEVGLLQEFEKKAFKAANLEILKKQMREMEDSFGALVKQLPSDTEVPELLEDISQLGIDSGLEFDSIVLGNERVVEFYAELPIQISVKGPYHSLGGFISGVASLPRIVTLHDLTISPVSEEVSGGMLSMSITAKTYRYNDEEA